MKRKKLEGGDRDEAASGGQRELTRVTTVLLLAQG